MALRDYQYYGLVGQGVAQAGASLIQGVTAASAAEVSAAGSRISATGFESSAEAFELQAEMETIAADSEANARLELLNETLTKNTVANIAMGRRSEGSADVIERANIDAANQDVEAIERKGGIRRIQAKSAAIGARKSASAAKSEARQKNIAGKAAFTQGVLGSVTSLATLGAVASSVRPPARTSKAQVK